MLNVQLNDYHDDVMIARTFSLFSIWHVECALYILYSEVFQNQAPHYAQISSLLWSHFTPYFSYVAHIHL